ncbi:MAG: DUF3883 domain-containing protein [Methanosarcinales archaeon]|nr:DUF3883 domain-containing protein [Methanosarcinales archaeon]
MSASKEFIETIKEKIIKSDEEYILDSLTGAIDRIQKTFPRYGSFLMEFVQNADDANSQSLKIEILQDSMKISNDGIPFTEENVKPICKVGRSSKTPDDFIGYLGVGFKAVFLISDCPEIFSGNFRFKFDKYNWDNPTNIPWQVIPLWIEESLIDQNSNYQTIFNIPLKDVKLIEVLKEEVAPDHLNDRILLFLRNIRKIEIIDHNQNTKRVIVKSLFCKTKEYEIYSVNETINEDPKNQDFWLIFRSTIPVPDNVKEDFVTKEWERENVENREVVVAFKLDDGNNLIKEEKGTAHIGVFSFLPLKEVDSGLNFLMQADFLTTPGRGELARESLWNNWLANEIYNLIIEKCLPELLEHEKWKLNITNILMSSEGGHELFNENIKKPLKLYLENNPVLIAEDGSTIRAKEAVSITTKLKKMLSDDDLTILYPGKKILDQNCSVPYEIDYYIEREPTFNASSGLSEKMNELLNIKKDGRDIKFFVDFYHKYLIDYTNSTQNTLNKLKSHNIVLTDDWNLINVHSAYIYINSDGVKIPDSIEGSLKIIHLNLSQDSEILELFKVLDVEILSETHIQNIIKIKEIPQLIENWTSLSENEKIAKTKECKKLYEDRQINAKDLDFLELMSKNNEWLKAEDLTFAKEYKPQHKIEELYKRALLTPEDLQRLNINFLNDVYIMDIEKNEHESWYDFFKNLGLEKNLNTDNIVERIGINTALEFERFKNRDAKELTRSEESGGYDIESNSRERLIEVKGRKDSSPKIWLTHKQITKVNEEGDKYYLYAVRDALKYPILSEIKGLKLLDVNYSMSIDFNKWKELSEEDFQPSI